MSAWSLDPADRPAPGQAAVEEPEPHTFMAMPLKPVFSTKSSAGARRSAGIKPGEPTYEGGSSGKSGIRPTCSCGWRGPHAADPPAALDSWYKHIHQLSKRNPAALDEFTSRCRCGWESEPETVLDAALAAYERHRIAMHPYPWPGDECPDCEGHGANEGHTCQRCLGTGSLRKPQLPTEPTRP
jgi:hypothetical protein